LVGIAVLTCALRNVAPIRNTIVVAIGLSRLAFIRNAISVAIVTRTAGDFAAIRLAVTITVRLALVGDAVSGAVFTGAKGGKLAEVRNAVVVTIGVALIRYAVAVAVLAHTAKDIAIVVKTILVAVESARAPALIDPHVYDGGGAVSRIRRDGNVPPAVLVIQIQETVINE
jgi:hypothetical protein